MRKFFKKNQTGQSIVEIIVTIAIASMIVVALITLSTRANKSANSSSNQETAKNLANQWIEIIQSIKAANNPGSVVHYCAGGYIAPRSPDMPGCAGGNIVRSTAAANPAFFGRSFSDIFSYDFREASDPASDPVGGSLRWEEDLGMEIHLHTNLASYAANPSYVNVSDPAPNDCDVAPQGWCLDLEIVGSHVLNIAGVNYEIFTYLADTPRPSGYSECNLVAGPESVGYVNGAGVDPFDQGDYDQIKQFTVWVGWSDQSGAHNVTSVACITRN